MRLIGLDCATQDAKIGVAVGTFERGVVRVSRAEVCSRTQSALSVILGALKGATDALIAIDAPLGWPISLAMALQHRAAGDTVRAEPEQLFRRETDRFIKRETGKTPLDVRRRHPRGGDPLRNAEARPGRRPRRRRKARGVRHEAKGRRRVRARAGMGRARARHRGGRP